MLKTNKLNWKNEITGVMLVIFVSIIVAVGLHVFVYKADFAPSGVDGMATILQYASESWFGRKINAGIFTFALNLPLLIAAWFLLNKRYVIYTIIYTVVISVVLMILGEINFIQYDCTIEGTYNSHIVAAIFGGVMQGFSGILLRIGGSAGGADVIGCMLQKKMPHKNVEKLIAYVSYAVVAVAFFVYGNLNSVCLSVIEIFICEKVTSVILKSNRSAIKVEIITDKAHVDEIKNYIIFELRHGATMLKANGAFSEQDKEMIVCLINFRQIPEFLKRVKNIPNTFLYYSEVEGVRGNFDFNFEDENLEDTSMREKKIIENESVKKEPLQNEEN